MTVVTSPLVSVCVPTHNMGRFLVECVESVLAQNVDDWELIICDDRSTDDSVDICRSFAQRDPRIQYFLNEQKLGMFENFRRTVDHARAPFLKFLCADDWLRPECLRVCLDLIQTFPTSVLVAAGCIDVDGTGRQISSTRDYALPRTFYRGATLIRRQMLGFRAIGGNSSFFVRRRAYDDVGGFDVSFRYAADNHLGLRLCQVGDFVSTNQPLFYGRHHGQQSSHRSVEDLTPVRDWLEIPRAILTGGPAFGSSWWLMRMAIGRVAADHILVGLFRVARGRGRSGVRLVAFVLRHGRPWWPAAVLVPIRLIVLTWRGVRRRTRRVEQSRIWRPSSPATREPA